MKNDNQRIWTTGLRSDLFQQGRERLVNYAYRDTDDDKVKRHCCLGVACVKYGLEEKHEEFEVVRPGSGSSWYDVVLPPEVSEWLGVTDEDPIFDMSEYKDRSGRPLTITCAHANDAMNLSFVQIAGLVDYFGLADA